MGYMGLDHYQDSDNASNLAYTMGNAMAEVLMKGLKKKDNEYNTDGPVNVALVFEGIILPHRGGYRYHKELKYVAKCTRDRLLQKIKNSSLKDFYSQENRNFHINEW